jgi:hypothetical protein
MDELKSLKCLLNSLNELSSRVRKASWCRDLNTHDDPALTAGKSINSPFAPATETASSPSRLPIIPDSGFGVTLEAVKRRNSAAGLGAQSSTRLLELSESNGGLCSYTLYSLFIYNLPGSPGCMTVTLPDTRYMTGCEGPFRDFDPSSSFVNFTT